MLKIIPYASSSKGNMYLLKNEETNILLECGVTKEKIKEYLRGSGLLITNLDGCLISHCHT